ncbi:MAG: hypothetical protein QOD81_4387 [Solirubrobacteraceae bacterium]|jgi:hypothetical protein|nr:hypothetical protein [Solirubrobacteraceae bacterium]
MTAALWRRRRRPSAPSGPPSRPPRSPRPPRSRSPRHQESSPFGQEIAASVQRLASTTADLEKLVGRSRWRCRPSRAIGDDRGGPARRPDGMGPTNAGHLILGRDGRTAAARDGRASAPRAAGSPAAAVLMRSGRSEGRSSPALEVRRAGQLDGRDAQFLRLLVRIARTREARRRRLPRHRARANAEVAAQLHVCVRTVEPTAPAPFTSCGSPRAPSSSATPSTAARSSPPPRPGSGRSHGTKGKMSACFATSS